MAPGQTGRMEIGWMLFKLHTVNGLSPFLICTVVNVEATNSWRTHSPEIGHGADGLKLNRIFTGCIHKQVRHGFSVIVGA